MYIKYDMFVLFSIACVQSMGRHFAVEIPDPGITMGMETGHLMIFSLMNQLGLKSSSIIGLIIGENT